MVRTIFSIAVAILVLSVVALATTKPDFNGNWTMDRARSFGLPADMNQTLVITQNADQIDLETRLLQPNNERSVKDTYILDGKEHEFTPLTAPNQPPAKGKRTATWLPGDRGLQVTEVVTTQTEKGPVTSQVVRKWTISAQGELIIDMYVD